MHATLPWPRMPLPLKLPFKLPLILPRTLPLALPLLLAAALLAACSKAEPLAEPTRAVRTLTVSTQTAGTSHEYAADIRSRTESRLGFRVGGKIVRRLVNVGDSVKAGQVLAQLDVQDLKLGHEASRAAMAGAQAGLDQASADHKRFKELRDQGFISSAEMERRDNALKAAQAQFDQARAQSGVQGNQAAYGTLVADANGVITAVEAEPGMVVAAGAPVLRLAHDGPRDVVFAVPEDQVDAIKSLAAQPGRFTVKPWGATGQALPARIREIAAAADPMTRTFLVRAELDASDAARRLRLGQTASVLAEWPQIRGVIKLPLATLRQDQGHSAVWLVDSTSMTVRSQRVTVAGAEGNDAIIAQGLAPGQIVVSAGVHVLAPGQKVKFYVDPAAKPAAMGAPSAATSVARGGDPLPTATLVK